MEGVIFTKNVIISSALKKYNKKSSLSLHKFGSNCQIIGYLVNGCLKSSLENPVRMCHLTRIAIDDLNLSIMYIKSLDFLTLFA